MHIDTISHYCGIHLVCRPIYGIHTQRQLYDIEANLISIQFAITFRMFADSARTDFARISEPGDVSGILKGKTERICFIKTIKGGDTLVNYVLSLNCGLGKVVEDGLKHIPLIVKNAHFL